MGTDACVYLNFVMEDDHQCHMLLLHMLKNVARMPNSEDTEGTVGEFRKK